VSYRFDCADSSGRRRGLARARTVLDEGELVVLATESAYGVACDAFSAPGLAALRAAKGNRRLNPPVLIGSGRTLDGLATAVSRSVRDLAEAFWPGPLTLICNAQPTLDWGLGGPEQTVSLRMPLHPLALELLAATGPLALTAANAPGRPPPMTCEQATDQLGDAVSVYLDAGPVWYAGSSTVVDGRVAPPRVLRHGELTVATLREVVPELVDLEEATG
jgi:tRNA threonylcarbamoyl adenosine modification protein (Sua5/YciO/YrdC/YwlC family)